MKFRKQDIPQFTNNFGWTDAVKRGSYSVRVKVEWDTDMGAPWKVHDGHGPVSDWTTRNKAPGELVLTQDRNSKLYYDFAEACRIARRDGWGFNGQYVTTKKRGGGWKYTLSREAAKMTPRERAARAAFENFTLLRDWCNERWHWIIVGVEVSYRGAVLETDYCGGIEDYTDYWREHAAESASSIISAHTRERREVRYWQQRDVVTRT